MVDGTDPAGTGAVIIGAGVTAGAAVKAGMAITGATWAGIAVMLVAIIAPTAGITVVIMAATAAAVSMAVAKAMAVGAVMAVAKAMAVGAVMAVAKVTAAVTTDLPNHRITVMQIIDRGLPAEVVMADTAYDADSWCYQPWGGYPGQGLVSATKPSHQEAIPANTPSSPASAGSFNPKNPHQACRARRRSALVRLRERRPGRGNENRPELSRRRNSRCHRPVVAVSVHAT